MATKEQEKVVKQVTEYKYGFNVESKPVFKSGKGLTKEIVEEISRIKGEPEWMREFRLRAFEIYQSKPMPTWGGDLSGIKFDDIHYYLKPSDRPTRDWNEVPQEIKDTFERLGVPEAEENFWQEAEHSLKVKLSTIICRKL